MMRSQLVLLSLVSGSLATLLGRAGCAADNCARAVTGTRYTSSIQAQHTADCQSFMSSMIATITPATPTVTVTYTATSFSVIGSNSKRTTVPEINNNLLAERGNNRDAVLLPPSITPRSEPSTAELAARHNTQAGIPTYASACSNAGQYSSACSCAGITAATVTAPTPPPFTTTYYADSLPTVVPVCDPATNYGYGYINGTIEAGVDVQQVSLGPSLRQACCASCFAESSACFAYEYSQGICYLVYETSGSRPGTEYCPYGIYTISDFDTGSFYGLGPCGVFTDGRYGA